MKNCTTGFVAHQDETDDCVASTDSVHIHGTPQEEVCIEGEFVKLGDPGPWDNDKDDGDYALIEIPDALINKSLVRTHMPTWGGPTEGAFNCTDLVDELNAPPDGSKGRPTVPRLLVQYGHGIGFGEVWPSKGRAGFLLYCKDPNAPVVTFWGDYRTIMPVSDGDSGSAANIGQVDATGVLRGGDAFADVTYLSPFGGWTAEFIKQDIRDQDWSNAPQVLLAGENP